MTDNQDSTSTVRGIGNTTADADAAGRGTIWSRIWCRIADFFRRRKENPNTYPLF